MRSGHTYTRHGQGSCRACYVPIGRKRVPCSPEMAAAIVALLLADAGVGQVRDAQA